MELRSRKNKDLTGLHPGIAAAGLRLNTDQAVVDGEIVALDAPKDDKAHQEAQDTWLRSRIYVSLHQISEQMRGDGAFDASRSAPARTRILLTQPGTGGPGCYWSSL